MKGSVIWALLGQFILLCLVLPGGLSRPDEGDVGSIGHFDVDLVTITPLENITKLEHEIESAKPTENSTTPEHHSDDDKKSQGNQGPIKMAHATQSRNFTSFAYSYSSNDNNPNTTNWGYFDQNGGPPQGGHNFFPHQPNNGYQHQQPNHGHQQQQPNNVYQHQQPNNVYQHQQPNNGNQQPNNGYQPQQQPMAFGNFGSFPGMFNFGRRRK